MALALQSGQRMRPQDDSEGGSVPETFTQARLEATFRACRTLRHELATPLSAAGLHLELARRAAERIEGGITGKLRNGLDTGREQLDRATLLLNCLTALGSARTGEPGLVDFAALVRGAARDVGPDLERRGLSVRFAGPADGLWVDGFEDELEGGARQALLAGARWASAGEASIETSSQEGRASFTFRVPLSGDGPGDMLFRPRGGPGAALEPFLARWTFEAHGGTLDGAEDGEHLTVSASLPRVAP